MRLAQENVRCEALRPATDLTEGHPRRALGSEEDREADESLIADRGHLDHPSVGNG